MVSCFFCFAIFLPSIQDLKTVESILGDWNSQNKSGKGQHQTSYCDKQRMLSDKNKELFIERASPGLPSRKLNVPSKSKTSRKTKKKKTHLDFFQMTVVCSINFSPPEKEAIYISFLYYFVSCWLFMLIPRNRNSCQLLETSKIVSRSSVSFGELFHLKQSKFLSRCCSLLEVSDAIKVNVLSWNDLWRLDIRYRTQFCDPVLHNSFELKRL